MEQWKAISGLEGAYEVSDAGRVKSLPRYVRFVDKTGQECRRLTKERILKHGDSRGYQLVNLPTKGGGHKVAKVHFLVAKAFVSGKGTCVNHRNGDKANNRADNLEWSTPLDQQLHAVESGLKKQCCKVVGVRISDGERFEFPSQGAAAHAVSGYRTNSASIRLVLSGERPHALGYKWSKPDEPSVF
jgi:hypothetical protein